MELLYAAKSLGCFMQYSKENKDSERERQNEMMASLMHLRVRNREMAYGENRNAC
jgi:hypothetical protein